MMKKAMLVMALMLTGCNIPTPRYQVGDFVQAKLNGQKGQIKDGECGTSGCRYWVRFVSLNVATNTRLIGQDDPVDINTFPVVLMREFEIEPVATK